MSATYRAEEQHEYRAHSLHGQSRPQFCFADAAEISQTMKGSIFPGSICFLLAIQVGEPINASLAASNNEIFLRTDKALWCFANSK